MCYLDLGILKSVKILIKSGIFKSFVTKIEHFCLSFCLYLACSSYWAWVFLGPWQISRHYRVISTQLRLHANVVCATLHLPWMGCLISFTNSMEGRAGDIFFLLAGYVQGVLQRNAILWKPRMATKTIHGVRNVICTCSLGMGIWLFYL